MNKPSRSRLVAAVTDFDEELQRFERLSDEACAAKMSSERGLRRAARAAVDAADSEKRLGALMTAFSTALLEARADNEAVVLRLREREADITRRDIELRHYMERFEKLGTAAREVASAVAAAFASDAEGTSASVGRRGGRFDDVSAHIDRFVDDAKAFEEDARAADLMDLAHDVQALRKQIQSARNKLGARALSASFTVVRPSETPEA